MGKFIFTNLQDLWLEEQEKEKEHRGRLKFYDDGVEIDGYYYIEESRIDTETKLLKWMHQLMEKNWMDKEFALYFMEKVASHYKLNIYGC